MPSYTRSVLVNIRSPYTTQLPDNRGLSPKESSCRGSTFLSRGRVRSRSCQRARYPYALGAKKKFWVWGAKLPRVRAVVARTRTRESTGAVGPRLRCPFPARQWPCSSAVAGGCDEGSRRVLASPVDASAGQQPTSRRIPAANAVGGRLSRLRPPVARPAPTLESPPPPGAVPGRAELGATGAVCGPRGRARAIGRDGLQGRETPMHSRAVLARVFAFCGALWYPPAHGY